jgi:anthranilate synthase component 1
LNALPEFSAFHKLYRHGSTIPIRLEVQADTETPVSAFLKLAHGEKHAFLFESVEGGEHQARWSFLGVRPRSVLSWRLGDSPDPLAWIANRLERARGIRIDGTPRFAGGLVGCISYDAVRLFEPRVPLGKADELGFPDVMMMDFDTVLAFDNVRHTVQVIAEAVCAEGVKPANAYQAALRRIQRVLQIIRRPTATIRSPVAIAPIRLKSRVSRRRFEDAVRRARDYIRAGDCQQIVISQRFDANTALRPFELYRALRRVNPSPYLFFLKAGADALIGSSPETLVRLEEGEITVRPIAGTRPRGRTPLEDAKLEAELRADPKENAEHVMLVDLGRNDVGRVAEVGTVRVDVLKTVERYSHVMHLVSQVRGRIAKGMSALDVLRAAFPAGTVSGSPKVRAMEIIDALEPARRGPYAGAVGYFDRYGNMEMCIVIRTLLQSARRLSVQAGAGIVYDSRPAAEYWETRNKARALFVAVEEAARSGQSRG